MNIKELVIALDKEMTKVHEYYVDLHDELKNYSNRVLADEEFDTARNLIERIQITFQELYDGHHFIVWRTESSINAINSYANFIKQLQDAGFKEKESEDDTKDITPNS